MKFISFNFTVCVQLYISEFTLKIFWNLCLKLKIRRSSKYVLRARIPTWPILAYTYLPGSYRLYDTGRSSYLKPCNFYCNICLGITENWFGEFVKGSLNSKGWSNLFTNSQQSRVQSSADQQWFFSKNK